MNSYDIAQQVLRMKNLMPEVNRAVVAQRFVNLITDTMKAQCGDDDEKTLKWIKNDSKLFMAECQLDAPANPVNVNSQVNMVDVTKLIDKWEAAELWRSSPDDEFTQMSQESFNIKAALLRDLREILNAKPTTPGPQPGAQQG